MQNHENDEKPENQIKANPTKVFASDKPPIFETPAQKVKREWEEK